jgi:hypothetical protein
MAGIMSEKVEQPLPVGVVALRAKSYSAADDSIVVSLRTKYSTAERTYSVPADCLEDLIADLRRLSYLHPKWRRNGGKGAVAQNLDEQTAKQKLSL